MARTAIPFGDPKAAIRWSAGLSLDVNHLGFFSRNGMMGKGKTYCIEEKTELETQAGTEVSFDLKVNLVGEPVFGDTIAEGTEEALKYHTDTIKIDQVRHPVNAGGRMDQKRTVHNLRVDTKQSLRDYFAKLKDEFVFMYMSGARGINEDFIMNFNFNGFAQNAFRAPDADHILYGGSATSKASLTAADKMSRTLIEKAETKVRMVRATNRENANMQPLMIDGKARFMLVMSPFQEHDLRQDVGETGWATMQRDAAGATGNKSLLFIGGMGLVKNVILYSHENSIRFNDYGVGQNVHAGRALFCGAQAGVCAHGSTDKRKYSWHEEKKDAGNQHVITAGTIWGVQKSRFAGKDFGCMAVDTAATDPNA